MKAAKEADAKLREKALADAKKICDEIVGQPRTAHPASTSTGVIGC